MNLKLFGAGAHALVSIALLVAAMIFMLGSKWSEATFFLVFSIWQGEIGKRKLDEVKAVIGSDRARELDAMKNMKVDTSEILTEKLKQLLIAEAERDLYKKALERIANWSSSTGVSTIIIARDALDT